MKNIEEIREKLGPDYRVEEKDGVITVCDNWDGVEFARCVESRKGGVSGREVFEGQIYRITGWKNKHVMLISGFEIGWDPKGIFTPATEDEYVEQLKSKAKELYGEIKRGQIFDWSHLNLGTTPVEFQQLPDSEFNYYKEDDSFQLGGFPLYKQGEWAKKVEDPISNRVYVDPINCSISTPDYRINAFDQSFEPQEMSFSFSVQGIVVGIKHTKEIANHLSESLQSYLNKIP